jgi:hypothetical protein
MVHSDCVGSQCLHQSCVEGALFGIDERVVFVELIRNTWGRDTYQYAWSSEETDEFIPLMKNCVPSCLKNLAPVMEREEMAAAVESMVVRQRPMLARENSMLAAVLLIGRLCLCLWD